MLQIDVGGRPAEVVLELRGELTGKYCWELLRQWTEAHTLEAGGVYIVDTCCLTEIDHAGERVVRRLASEGARFRVGGMTAGTIIDLVCKEKRQALQEGHREFTSIVFSLRP